MEKETSYGKIVVDNPVIKTLISTSTRSCYGVVDVVAKRPFVDRLYDLFTDNQNCGIGLFVDDFGYYHVEVYIVIQVGLPVANICREVQKRIRYDLEKNLEMKISHISVFVDEVSRVR